jgi:hypothetical protein
MNGVTKEHVRFAPFPSYPDSNPDRAYTLALVQHNRKRQVGDPLFHIDYLYDDMVASLMR